MNIGELARRSGVKAETIRFYERTGVLAEPGRTVGNYRVYDEEHLQRLNLVRELADVGFDLAEMPTLLGLLSEIGSLDVGAIRASSLAGRLDEKIATLRRLQLALGLIATS